jgi:uncharacterized protein (DUF58 family)
MKALQGLGPWPIVVAVVMFAGLLLVRAWRVRRRRRLTVLREVRRLQREFAVRDALESREDPQM